MARLTTAQRNALPASDFAGPNRTYPIEDAGHRKAALGRVKEFGSPKLQTRVAKAVHKAAPNMSGGHPGRMEKLKGRT